MNGVATITEKCITPKWRHQLKANLQLTQDVGAYLIGTTLNEPSHFACNSKTATKKAQTRKQGLSLVSECTVQREAFGRLRPFECVSKPSPLHKLDMSVDEHGIISVGGRLKRAQLSHQTRHPIVKPKSGHATQLIIRHFHQRCFHQGKGITLNTLRTSGFWVINAASKSDAWYKSAYYVGRYVAQPIFKKWQIYPQTAIDFFGPFYVKDGRKILKRYGCLFTCLVSRAVYIEVAHSRSTDSSIHALRRFMSMRWPVRMLRFDRGTNFIGAKNEWGRKHRFSEKCCTRTYLWAVDCSVSGVKV